jgi:hypothetical protein
MSSKIMKIDPLSEFGFCRRRRRYMLASFP